MLSAAALLTAAIATPAAAQQAMQEPGAYLQDHPWANSHGYYGYRSYSPADVAVGVVTGTAAAIATAPYRDSYAYYGDPDDSYAYYGDRPVSRRTTCGLQSGATYMGPDGRWYPC